MLTVLLVLIPPLAILATWLAGFWSPVQIYDYGFPLPWKSCTIVPTVLGGNACYSNTYDWTSFLFDTVFFAFIGYGIIFLFRWPRGKNVII